MSPNSSPTHLINPSNPQNKFIGQNPYVTENPLGKSTDMVYQPFVLRQIMENRYDENNRQFKGLVKTQGLKWIPPDTGFEESIFTDLICDSNGNSKVKFLIVVTMYNEGVKNFKDTMLGIAKNLDAFRIGNVPAKSICCVVIVDGMRPFLETYYKQKDFFAQYFDEDMVKDRFNVENCEDCKYPGQHPDKEFAHCFMQNAIFEDHEPLQLIFCVKQQNKGKLNTHLWFLGGFCEMFNPKYVMLLDVGTKPLDDALFLLYEAMKTDKKIAGCCGEIRPMQTNI